MKGDAAGELDVGDGDWTESLRERYADRIQARIARHVPNLESSILRRVVLSPADLQEANINLERGDPYSGSLALDQNFLWRPFARQPGPPHRRRRPLPHRREHMAGPGLGAGRDPRREGAVAAAGGERLARRLSVCGPGQRRIPCIRPRFSISQITTLASTFADDVRAYAAAGVDGIGVWEIKLPAGGDAEALEQLEASGLGSAAAIPAVPSILPLPLMEGPRIRRSGSRRSAPRSTGSRRSSPAASFA